MVASSSKVHVELFIFNFLGICFSLVNSDFNFEEIYGVKYGFEISKEPVLLKEVSFLASFLCANDVTQRLGICFLTGLPASCLVQESGHLQRKIRIPRYVNIRLSCLIGKKRIIENKKGLEKICGEQ